MRNYSGPYDDVFLSHPVRVKYFSPGQRPGFTNQTPTQPSPEAGEGKGEGNHYSLGRYPRL
jgi:hypothetical protein